MCASRTALLVTSLLTSLVACSSTERRLDVATFNAGLSEQFVEGTNVRAPLVAEAVADLPADVVCLQEVWDSEHVDAILDANPHRPHRIVLEPNQQAVPGDCDQASLEPLAACVSAACADPPSVECIFESCSEHYDAQTSACQVCLATNVDNTIDDIVSSCTIEADRYLDGGSYGLMLLSSVPFASEHHIELEAALHRRAVLHARLEDETDVFCTHLTALEDLTYPGDGSWDEEQEVQADALAGYVSERGTGAAAVLLGDLNFGPDEAPERFQQIRELGFTGALENSCTFCSDNGLVSDDTVSITIDHALGRGGVVSPRRILDESDLSDHYGVSAELLIEE